MKTFRACLLLAGALLTACGTDAPRRPAEPVAAVSRHVLSTQAPATAATQAPADPFADPRLDPIRDKVPLVVRANAVTAAHLTLDRRPTREERPAIRLWQEIRERQHESAPPPSSQLIQTRMRVTRAIVQLYAGQLTYAAFAQRLREIDTQHQAANRHRVGQR